MSIVKLTQVISAVAEIHGRQLSQPALEMIVKDLMDYPFDDVITAIDKARRELRGFPTIADIISRIPGQAVNEEDIARDIGNRIWDAIGRFGWTNQARAQEFLGEMGWSVVERMGGWQNLCTMDSEERGTFVAQARDFAMSRMRLERAGHGAGGYKIPTPESPSALPSRIDQLVDTSVKDLRESTARLEKTTKQLEARTLEMRQ